MKRTWLPLTILTFMIAVLLVAEPVQAQRDNSRSRPSPNATVGQTIGTTTINLHYSRPGVKGRTIYGDLVPYDQVWRAGANEPTTIDLPVDVMIEGEKLAAGSYSLFILPRAEGNWSVVFSEMVAWGTQYDESKEVLRVDAMATEAPAQEWMNYSFTDLSNTSAKLVMSWGGMMTGVTITLPEE